jgi:regulatory protein
LGRLTDERAALDAALRFLTPRPRSEREVRRRLERGGCSAETIEAVLTRLREHGYIDDAAFARYWVDQRQTFRPRGARLLQAELRQHGVSTTLVPTRDAEADAYRAAVKRAHQLRDVDTRAFKKRIGGLLARRGFEWDVITPTVDRLFAEMRAVRATQV